MTEQQPNISNYDVTDAAIEALKVEFSGLTATDTQGYKDVTKAIAKVRTYRTSTDKKRLELNAEAQKHIKEINAEAKVIIAKLQAVEDPLKELKQAVDDEKARIKAEAERVERERVEGIELRINEMRNIPFELTRTLGVDSSVIKAEIAKLERVEITEENFAELIPTAIGVREEALNKLDAMGLAAVERENERLRLEEQKREQDSAAATQAAVAEKNRLEQEAKEKALADERATLEAEKLELEEKQQAATKDSEAPTVNTQLEEPKPMVADPVPTNEDGIIQPRQNDRIELITYAYGIMMANREILLEPGGRNPQTGDYYLDEWLSNADKYLHGAENAA